jgi:hypothetical protein
VETATDMKTVTVNQARRLLGKDAQGISDEELESDIEAAALFCSLFIDFRTKNRKTLAKTPLKCHNMAQYGNK